MTILHHYYGEGNSFSLLGPVFDAKLTMNEAVQKLVKRARPKLKALLKTRPFFSDADLLLQFKAHVRSILESSIAAIYHASDTVLAPLDHVQESLL